MGKVKGRGGLIEEEGGIKKDMKVLWRVERGEAVEKGKELV